MLVAGTLGLVVLGMFFGLLLPSLRISDRSRVGGDLRQTASVVMHKIQKLATQSAPEGFSWNGNAPTVIAFNLVARLQNDGFLVWRSDYEVLWWDEAEKTLLHQIFTPTDALLQNPTRPKRLDPATLMGLTSSLSNPNVWARGVTEFTMSHGGGPADLRQPVLFTLSLEGESADGKVEFQTRNSILLVNQR